MLKTIIVGIVTAVAVSLIFYLTQEARSVQIGIPKGAVIAFNSNSCPDEVNWREYENAYGRFIRGLDKSGELIDPESGRGLGSLQEDSFTKHRHGLKVAYHGAREVEGWSLTNNRPTTGFETPHMNNEEGGSETRPKNVALLYCEKI